MATFFMFKLSSSLLFKKYQLAILLASCFFLLISAFNQHYFSILFCFLFLSLHSHLLILKGIEFSASGMLFHYSQYILEDEPLKLLDFGWVIVFVGKQKRYFLLKDQISAQDYHQFKWMYFQIAR
ncbi:MAG TPA: hypothetical protein DCZ80_05800 [Legionellales bacterium]|nr:hypothetical protein [Legionellales bacterium]